MTELEVKKVGMLGVGSMGAMLTLLMAERGYEVYFYDPNENMDALERQCKAVRLEPRHPRTALGPHLAPGGGDAILDCGNEHWGGADGAAAAAGARGGPTTWGAACRGGHQSARAGPSMSPGGSAAALARVMPALARGAGQPCAVPVGPGGSGHYVKMAHNGIEQGMMSVVAEVWLLLLTRGLGLGHDEVGDVFRAWKESGPLRDCFLVARVRDQVWCRTLDEEEGTGHLDRAARGGGVRARALSLEFVETLRTATDRGWGLAGLHGGLLQLWRGGRCCIIKSEHICGPARPRVRARARTTTRTTSSGTRRSGAELARHFPAAKQVVLRAVEADLFVPAIGQTLEYYKYETSTEPPTQFVEAQLDYFGQHMFDRKDDPIRGPAKGQHHYEWKPARGSSDE
ncbi:6-phosphogluconate dehydrogenase [Biscogniauxia marginata]|nr:6-phosphogluconate dehydrogenase [Biscogniauxia marginata]